MNKKTAIWIIRIILLLAIIAMMAVIFMFSSESGAKSSETSSSVTNVVIDVVVPTYEEMPAEEQVSVFDKVHSILRKCAHFFNFMVLGMLVCCFLETFKIKKRWIFIPCSLGYCFLYACSDEFHQKFVDNRGPSFKDVLIDSSGSLLGIVIIFLIFELIYYILNKKKKTKENTN